MVYSSFLWGGDVGRRAKMLLKRALALKAPITLVAFVHRVWYVDGRAKVLLQRLLVPKVSNAFETFIYRDWYMYGRVKMLF